MNLDPKLFPKPTRTQVILANITCCFLPIFVMAAFLVYLYLNNKGNAFESHFFSAITISIVLIVLRPYLSSGILIEHFITTWAYNKYKWRPLTLYLIGFSSIAILGIFVCGIMYYYNFREQIPYVAFAFSFGAIAFGLMVGRGIILPDYDTLFHEYINAHVGTREKCFLDFIDGKISENDPLYVELKQIVEQQDKGVNTSNNEHA